MQMKNYQNTATPKATTIDGVPVFCAHDKLVSVMEVIPNPKNPNEHPEDQVELLARIIKAGGWRNPITVSTRSGFIVKGHGRLLAAIAAGMQEVPVDFQNYASEAQEWADLTADNRLAELSEINSDKLAAIFRDIDVDEIPIELTGYNADEFADIIAALDDCLTEPEEIQNEDELPKQSNVIVTQRGDIWQVGRHRVMCGDCTHEKNREKLFDGALPEILLTDPPYCSGGFQESGRSAGSIGTRSLRNGERPSIVNDTLSTRGYQALIKNVLHDLPCKYAYIFTDWRMWVYLYDSVESNGYNIKSMIVWDKKNPGLGVGWRAQHELIMSACKASANFDKHKAYGNVLQCTRSGNPLHPTQKPVELIEKLVDNTMWVKGVFEPFGGSGTTLIACEKYGQQCFAMELEPHFVDTIVQRYMLVTGRRDVKLIRDGQEQPPEVIEPLFDSIGDVEAAENE